MHSTHQKREKPLSAGQLRVCNGIRVDRHLPGVDVIRKVGDIYIKNGRE